MALHPGGQLHTDDDGETAAQATLADAGNAYATLMAGFTTVQSPGSPEDADLREDRRAGGRPRTAHPDLRSKRSPTERLARAAPRPRSRAQGAGADLIKIFASKSIRDGGAQTMTDEQLSAACGEAKALGLRTLVHAHSAEIDGGATLAGCTQVEHGVFVTGRGLDLMAARGTCTSIRTSRSSSATISTTGRYHGIGNYNDEGFAAMERAIPLAAATFRRALATTGLKIIYGTDAVAGAHGRNVEDLVCRVTTPASRRWTRRCGDLRAAESLRLGDRIGAIAPGLEADLIAVPGDPDATSRRAPGQLRDEGRKVFRGPEGLVSPLVR